MAEYENKKHELQGVKLLQRREMEEEIKRIIVKLDDRKLEIVHRFIKKIG